MFRNFKSILSLLLLGCVTLIVVYCWYFSPILTHSNIKLVHMGQTLSSKSQASEFSVLSWNIWFGSRYKWDHPEERWKELLRISLQKNPDIIGFQECTDPFLHLVKECTDFNSIYVAVNEKPVYSRYFVMIYMKRDLKLVKKETVLLKTDLDRRCEVATVKKDGGSFRFATVHIESYVTSPNIREIQMQTFFDHLNKKESSTEISFLVGDFNFDDSEKEYKFLQESPFLDTWRVINKDAPGISFETTNNLMNQYEFTLTQQKPLTLRLDRIVYRVPSDAKWNPVLCELLGTVSFQNITADGVPVPLFPSDHYGIFAKFNRPD